MGRDLRIPATELQADTAPPTEIAAEAFMEEAFGGWEGLQEVEHSRLAVQEAEWRRKHRPVLIKENEEVLVSTYALKGRKLTHIGGLRETWTGPCNVTKVEGPNVTIALPPEYKNVEIVLHQSHLKPVGMPDEEWDFQWFDSVGVKPNDEEIDSIEDVDWFLDEGRTKVMY